MMSWNTLLNGYANNGDVERCDKLFKKMVERNIFSWNGLIGGYSHNGRSDEVLDAFKRMLDESDGHPNDATLVTVLSACSKLGALDFGKWVHVYAKNNGYKENVYVWNGLVKCGTIGSAVDVFRNMALKDLISWNTIINGLAVHGHGADALSRKVTLSSLLMREWRLVEQIRELMNDKGVRNGHVWSWIQINQKIHHFSAIGEPHPDEGQIYFELYHLILEMKKLGYVPDISCVYQRMDKREKEKVLLMHTEKLALTYGLMNVKSGKPIRVVKNTGICSDCHEVAKYMTLLSKREILLKDGVRFHKFSEGKCSCRDRW